MIAVYLFITLCWFLTTFIETWDNLADLSVPQRVGVALAGMLISLLWPVWVMVMVFRKLDS